MEALSWRAARICLDLFNPADQPSDRSMCAGNGCQMRWGQLRKAGWVDAGGGTAGAQTNATPLLELLSEATAKEKDNILNGRNLRPT